MARTKLSVATWNLYNLNLPGLPIYWDSDGWDQQAYDNKVLWSTGILRDLESDVWGFQELWHKQALQEIFDAAGKTEEYELLVPEDHSGQHIICAAAVRKKILREEAEWITDFPEKFHMSSGGDDAQSSDISVIINKFSRPILHFKIRPRSNGKTISVYVVHFKSKRPADIYREKWYKDDNEYYAKHRNAIGSALSTVRRTAEVCALRMILNDEMKHNENPVIVLGDCNDAQHSNTLNILTEQPNYLLSGYSKGGSDTGLYTVETLQEFRSLKNVYYTHIYKNTRESLDHILVSQEFYDNSRKRLWAFKGMDLYNDHLNTDEHKTNGTTDHGIVRTQFEYRPAK